jgi:hypothetical protein
LHSEALDSENDSTLCKFFPHEYAGDSSNWWAFGIQAICGMLEACGLSEVQVITEVGIMEVVSEKLGAGHGMSRTAFLARKPV